MIYLTFDTNIWVYLLDDSWKDYNPLDTLEHWIGEGLITILLPEIIIEEWERKKNEHKAERIKKLKDFFSLADEVLPTAFIGDRRKPENLENEVNGQFERIERLIKAKAKLLPLDNTLKDKIIEWAVLKKAPMHSKSSMADTIIVLSILKFANENPSDEYCFVSANTDDFYSKKEGEYILHKDLKPEFDAARIQDFRNLNFLIQTLKKKLPITVDLDKIKKERRRKKSIPDIYNPEKMKSLEGVEDVFFENTKHIDFVLSSNKPTKQQILSIWALIESDNSYKQYFYNNVSKPLWFAILKTRDAFNPDNVPDPVPVSNGFQMPYWEVLSFLEKVSLQIKEGKSIEFVDEILSIIKNVSQRPKENYRVWYVFIRILNNLPNDKVPIEILKFIPLWISGGRNASLQSDEICENLLPKFLNEAPSKNDIERAELILHYLFQIEKDDSVQVKAFDMDTNRYRSIAHLSYLSNSLVRKRLFVRVVKYCSVSFILDLGRTIKYLLLDHPNGINTRIKDNENEYEIKTLVEKENLIISAKSIDKEEVMATTILNDFEDYSDDELKRKLLTIFSDQGIKYKPNDEDLDTVKRITYSINNDFNSVTGFNTIRKLGDRYYNDEKILSVFALIFRELLTELAKQKPNDAILLLKTICYDKKYRLPFFKRVALFVISESWSETKSVFWDLVKNNDVLQVFSNHKYKKELYDVLNKSQMLLTNDEKDNLQKIIEQGDQDRSRDKGENHLDYWQLQWYSALRDIEPFARRYEELSTKLNIKHEHYENLGEFRLRSGSITPISKDDLSKKTNAEIADFLKSFQPKDRWEEPNISGLCDTLKVSVEENPEKFSDEIELYSDVAYIYSYHILNAFSEAWKKQKSFNWEKVLNYCLDYIRSPKFYSEQLKAENDDWNASADWVVGSIAYLLTYGMQNDDHAFDIRLMPLAKEIIHILIKNLKPVEDFEDRNMDYVTYSFNSTAGKVLRALFDYSLRIGRSDFKKEDKEKWSPEMKALFEETLQKDILDGHIMMGLYFEQFYFLDRDWIVQQAKKHYDIEEGKWLPFIHGYVLGNALSSKDLYELFYPHFDRAIESKIEVKHFHNRGIVRHLTAFYFWGFETLNDKKLLWKFLNTMEPDCILELVNFIWQQGDYSKSLSESERKNFDKIILNLWKFLVSKFKKSESEDGHKVLAALCNWVVLMPELNDIYAKLILESCKYIHKTYSTHELIENLVTIKEHGDPVMVAKNIGKVISSMDFSDYISEDDKNNIKALVIFANENGQGEMAITFCNNMASVYGQYFLRDLHDRGFENGRSEKAASEMTSL